MARVRGGGFRAERPTEPTHVFRPTNGAEAHHRRCLSGVMQASSLECFVQAERRLSGEGGLSVGATATHDSRRLLLAQPASPKRRRITEREGGGRRWEPVVQTPTL